MSTLYWITRLDALNTVFFVFLVISCVLTVVAGTMYLSNYLDTDGDNDDPFIKLGLKLLKISCPVLLVTLIGIVFVPTTKDAYIIWGVGSTIDYIKDNPTAKQLPDKCINALDAWVDTWVEETDSTNSKK